MSQTWKEDGYDGDVDMPGSLDVGAPMIIHENGRRTVIGMFLRQMQGAAVFNQITPDTFNWIQENAEETGYEICISSSNGIMVSESVLFNFQIMCK